MDRMHGMGYLIQGSKMKRCVWLFCGALILILGGIIFFRSKYIIIMPKESYSECKIGIIDENLGKDYKDKVILSRPAEVTGETGHGDILIQFLKACGYGGVVYYYVAENSDGDIGSEEILDGLKWMKKQGIKTVNISMSSHYYDEDLSQWISDNCAQMQIYASYNNLENTFDYPAMYNNVIASGKRSAIVFKDCDINYRTNNIIIVNKKTYIYKGNSFLSLLTVLNDL